MDPDSGSWRKRSSTYALADTKSVLSSSSGDSSILSYRLAQSGEVMDKVQVLPSYLTSWTCVRLKISSVISSDAVLAFISGKKPLSFSLPSLSSSVPAFSSVITPRVSPI